MFRSSARGFTLLELLITAGIGMLIIASAYSVYRTRENDTKVREAAALVGFLNKTALSVSASTSAFQVPRAGAATNITNQDMLDGFASVSNTLPFGSALAGTQIYGPFGVVTTSVMSSAAGANDLFAVDMPGIPSKSCLQLMERALNFAPIYDMYVNGSLVPLWPAPTKDGAGNIVARGRSDVRADMAAPLCSVATNVTIRFRMLKEINFSDLRRQQLGTTMSAAESAVVTPLYNRQNAAMAAREAAQAAF